MPQETFTAEQFWKKLDDIGEDKVRENIVAGRYSTANKKLQLAEEWVRRKVQSRNDERETESLEIAASARDAAVDAARAAEAAASAAEEQANRAREANNIAKAALIIAIVAMTVSAAIGYMQLTSSSNPSAPATLQGD